MGSTPKTKSANTIERTKIEGRLAYVAWLDDNFDPAPKDKATLGKIIFDDGGTVFFTPDKQA
jgi:hypothetical protein